MRTRAVDAVLREQPVGQEADAFRVDRTRLFRWVQRVDDQGTQGLKLHAGSGRPRLVPNFDKLALNHIVLEPAVEFGFETDLWTVGNCGR
jgi:hypothetical protein